MMTDDKKKLIAARQELHNTNVLLCMFVSQLHPKPRKQIVRDQINYNKDVIKLIDTGG